MEEKYYWVLFEVTTHHYDDVRDWPFGRATHKRINHRKATVTMVPCYIKKCPHEAQVELNGKKVGRATYFLYTYQEVSKSVYDKYKDERYPKAPETIYL
jgi:hypothetical protein